jgi:hypothetical protein
VFEHDTAADSGTIYYVRGSDRWPHAALGGSFHAPDDWLAHARAAMPAGAELDMISSDTRWNLAHPHPIYSRYRRPGEIEMDEAFFPVLWRDGYRTPWLDEYAAVPAAA